MSRRDKRLERVRANMRAVHAEQLRALLEDHGFVCRRTADGHLCRHGSGMTVQFAVTHGGREKAGLVRPSYVKAAIRTIDALAAEEDES